MADAIEAFVRDTRLETASARRARQALRALIEAEIADLPERQSLRWMWNEVEYGGDFFGDLPDGGYRSLVEAMASGVEVRLGVEVAEVALSASGVRVRSADGTVEEGSHVVVAVPLGVLKRGMPRFSPALPPDRAAAIERLGFGRFEKVALRFDQPFWRAAGVSHLMVFPRDPYESTEWMFGLEAFGAGPTLVCLSSTALRTTSLNRPPTQRPSGSSTCSLMRSALHVRSRWPWRCPRGQTIPVAAARTRTSLRERAPPTSTCSASRSAAGSCLRESTPKARD